MLHESWSTIPGYEGQYEISDWGRCRSIDRVVKGRDGSTRWIQGKIIKPHARRDGVIVVNLWRESKYRQKQLRRLVLEVFDQPQPAGQDARNLDGDPHNNRRDNLTWS